MTQSSRVKRPELTAVGIRKSVRQKLREYIYGQYPSPTMSEVVSVAVEQYIERETAERERREALRVEK